MFTLSFGTVLTVPSVYNKRKDGYKWPWLWLSGARRWGLRREGWGANRKPGGSEHQDLPDLQLLLAPLGDPSPSLFSLETHFQFHLAHSPSGSVVVSGLHCGPSCMFWG